MKQLFSVLVLIFLTACNSESRNPIDENQKASDTLHFPAVAQADSLLPFPAVFESVFSQKKKILSDQRLLVFTAIRIGKITVKSGRIMASSPEITHELVCLNADFPIGEFPVDLAIAQMADGNKLVGFSRIKFSSEPVTEWRPVNLSGGESGSIRDSVFYGFSVDSGTALYADSLAMEKVNAERDADATEVYMKNFVEPFYKPGFDLGFCQYAEEFSFPVFRSGGGDGVYSSFIGLDKDGNICRLLTDFDLVHWMNY